MVIFLFIIKEYAFGNIKFIILIIFISINKLLINLLKLNIYFKIDNL